MSKTLLHCTAIWKLGHQRFESREAIIGKNISRIEKVPEEIPDYTDGCISRIQLAHGEMFYVKEPFDDLITAWEATLESL